MKEIWKDIEGYEGLYMVSNLGNVKSMNYCHRGYAQNLVPKTNNSGRLWVELANNGKRKPMLIHRLVAMAFIPNPEGLPQVNHIDENPKNNRLDNLEWCTNEYNQRYSYDRHPERHRDPTKTPYRRKTGRTNGNRKQLCILQVSIDGRVLRKWENSRTIFIETGMSDWSISECCRGKRKKAYGFRWQYAT